MNSTGSIYLIPGEKILNTTSINQGVLILTNYRLILIVLNPESTYSIPISLLWKVELVELVHVKVTTKIGISVMWSFQDELASEANFSHILSIIDTSKPNESMFARDFRLALESSPSFEKHPFLLKPSQLLLIDDVNPSLDVALVRFEFRRMNFDNSWKITNVNEEFKVCSTYPRFHIVPRTINDSDIVNMASFRSHNRFSSVVWRSQVTGAVLLRCAQPCVGLMYSRNEYDEKFLRSVLSSCQKNPGENPSLEPPRLLIVDARNYSTAQFNRLRGGGFEYSEYYDQAQICFMDLPNLHIVRVSYERLTQLYSNKPDINWYAMLEKTSWLTYIGQLLKSATEIACALELHGRPVMVHCTDGWDRTPQLCSLAQILADPFYRTIKGFRILIEREWLQFGHKFADRNGQGGGVCNNLDERSPIFIQWLDCVHQIFKQFPHCFEFNESFLLKLGLHIYSGLFGTFLYNSEQERSCSSIADKTCSLWALLSEKHNWTIENYFFDPQIEERLLKPRWQIRALSLWNTLYETALAPMKGPTNNSNVRSSTPTNEMSISNHDLTEAVDNNLTTTVPTNSSIIDPYPHMSSMMMVFDFDDSTRREHNSSSSAVICQNENLLLSENNSPSFNSSNMDIGRSKQNPHSIDNNNSYNNNNNHNYNPRRHSLNDLVNVSNTSSVHSTQSPPESPIHPLSLSTINSTTTNNNGANDDLAIMNAHHQPAIIRLNSVSDLTVSCCSDWLTNKSAMQSKRSSNVDNRVAVLPTSDLDQTTLLDDDDDVDVDVANHMTAQSLYNNNTADRLNSHRLLYANPNSPILPPLSQSPNSCTLHSTLTPPPDTDPQYIQQRHQQSSPITILSNDVNSRSKISTQSNDCSNNWLLASSNTTTNTATTTSNPQDYDNTRPTTLPDSQSTSRHCSSLSGSMVETTKTITRPTTIRAEFINNNSEAGYHPSKKISSPEFTIHSLPENEGLLINGTSALDCDAAFASHKYLLNNSRCSIKNSCSNLNNASTNLFQNSMADSCSTRKWNSCGQQYEQRQQSGNCAPHTTPITTPCSPSSLPSSILDTYREQYFRIESLSKFITTTISSTVLSSHDASRPISSFPDLVDNPHRILADNSNKIIKCDKSCDLNNNNSQLLSENNLSLMTNHKANINISDTTNQRPVSSAPISPLGECNDNDSNKYSNGLRNPSQNNVNNQLNFDHRGCLSSPETVTEACQNLLDIVKLFPDWDGLPMLVDRLTIQMYHKTCQYRHERQLQKHQVSSYEAKLKCAQLELGQLTAEITRLKQLLLLQNTTNHQQQYTDSLLSKLITMPNNNNNNYNNNNKQRKSSLLNASMSDFDAINIIQELQLQEQEQRHGQHRSQQQQQLYVATNCDNLNWYEENPHTDNMRHILDQMTNGCDISSNSHIQSSQNRTSTSHRLSNSGELNSFEMVNVEEGQFVTWQPDSTAHHCTLCSVEFSVIRHKHHCRQCGYIFCDNCSDKRIALPDQLITQPVRVCRKCYASRSQMSHSTTTAATVAVATMTPNVSTSAYLLPVSSPLAKDIADTVDQLTPNSLFPYNHYMNGCGGPVLNSTTFTLSMHNAPNDSTDLLPVSMNSAKRLEPSTNTNTSRCRVTATSPTTRGTSSDGIAQA